jgi:hypothetical protein
MMMKEVTAIDGRPRNPHRDSLVEMAGAIWAAAEVRAIDPLPVVPPQPKAPRTGKKPPDFHAVEANHREIDGRLRNWALWCTGSNVPMTSPMFRMTPPPPRVRGDLAYSCNNVDRMDAANVAKAVAALPAPHRTALNWCYIKPVSPKKACQALGTTMEGLALFVRQGRQMLINRSV